MFATLSEKWPRQLTSLSSCGSRALVFRFGVHVRVSGLFEVDICQGYLPNSHLSILVTA